MHEEALLRSHVRPPHCWDPCPDTLEIPKERGAKVLAGRGSWRGTTAGPGSHEEMEGGGNPRGHAPLLLLSSPSLQETLPEGWSRSGLGQKTGQGAQVRRGTCIFPLQKEGSGVCRLERQRAAQWAGKWEQVQEGGAGDQVIPQVTLAPQGTAISN